MKSRFQDGVKVYGVWCTYIHFPPKLPKCISKFTIHWVSGKIIIVYFTHPSTATYMFFLWFVANIRAKNSQMNHILCGKLKALFKMNAFLAKQHSHHWSSGNVSNKSKQDLSAYTLPKHDTSQWMSPVNKQHTYIEPLKLACLSGSSLNLKYLRPSQLWILLLQYGRATLRKVSSESHPKKFYSPARKQGLINLLWRPSLSLNVP